MPRFRLALVFACIALLTGCSGGNESSARAKELQRRVAEATHLSPAFVEGNNAFALALYRETAPGDANFALSPFGVSTCMAMLYAGARGRTAEQMEEAVGFGVQGEALHHGFQTLLSLYAAADRAGTARLAIVNGLWKQEGYPFRPDFLAVLDTTYRPRVEEVDFDGHAQEVVERINQWCAEATRGMIPRILDGLGPLTRLVVADAIYYRGLWERPFQETLTQPEPFWLSATDSVSVPTMETRSHARYYEDDEIQVLWLPYADGVFAMELVLPRKREGLGDIVLDRETLGRWSSEAEERYVRIHLPRFEVEGNVRLIRPLQKLGMTDAFGGVADFSGIDGTQDLFVGQVRHRARVRVDEQGSEAVSATVAPVSYQSSEGAGEARNFLADHPFLFYLRDETTGTILFLGQVVDPRRP